MDEHIKAINQLAAAAGKAPRGIPHPMPNSRDPVYDFEHLGATLADSISAAADDLMAEASRIAEHMRQVAADIRLQVSEESRSASDLNTRLTASGELMLEAHRKFSGGA